MPRRAWIFLLLVLSFPACGGCSIPVVPVVPPAPGPGPGPSPGPVTPGVGSISEEQYGAVAEGASESAVLATLGDPFRRSTVSGYTVLVYAFAGTDHVAWFWIKNSVVERKSRL